MESNIQIFNSAEFGSVRTLMINDEPWFVANDVAKALGYAVPKDAVSTHCKGAVKQRLLTEGGEQEMKVIPEADLYRLILKSNLPSAEKFQDWVTEEVLPSIRKTGSYSTTPVVPLPSAFQDRYAIAKDLFSIVGIKGNQLVLALDKLYKHEAGYSLLEVTGTMLEAPEKEQVLTPTQIGQMLEPPMSAKAVNLKLMDMGYQHRIGDQLEPIGDGCIFAVMLDVGKAHSDGTPIRQLKWKSSILKNFR